VCARERVRTCMCVCVCVHVSIFVYMCVCVCARERVRICMYVCACIWLCVCVRRMLHNNESKRAHVPCSCRTASGVSDEGMGDVEDSLFEFPRVLGRMKRPLRKFGEA